MAIKKLYVYFVLSLCVNLSILSMEDFNNISKIITNEKIVYRADMSSKTYGNGTLTCTKYLLGDKKNNIECGILLRANAKSGSDKLCSGVSFLYYSLSTLYFYELERLYKEKFKQEEKKQQQKESDAFDLSELAMIEPIFDSSEPDQEKLVKK